MANMDVSQRNALLISSISTRNPGLDQKWSNPKFQVGPDLVHPGLPLVQPENAWFLVLLSSFLSQLAVT